VATTAGDSLSSDETVDQDRRLHNRIRRFLDVRGVNSRSNVEIEVHGGIVTLVGAVSSPHEHTLLCNCVRRVAGVIRLVDRLAVDDPSGRDRPSDG